MLNPSELKKIDAYWRASNYLAAGQLYLLDNPTGAPCLARTSFMFT